VPLHRIDYNRLRVFAAVHEAGSVQTAARQLRVTPSAVSQAVKALEREVDLRLLQRVGNRIRATAAGDRLAAIVSTFGHDLEKALGELRSLRNEPHGILRVGSAFEFGARVVVPAMRHLEAFRRFSVHLEFAAPEPLVRALVDQRIDLAFCDKLPSLKRHASVIAFAPVFTETLVLVCSKDFERRYVNGDVSFAHLVTLPHVDYVPDLSAVGLWYEHHFGRAPAALPLRLVSENTQAIIAAACAGLGLGLVPRYLVSEELARARLVAIRTRRKELTHEIVRAQLKDHVPGLGERMLVDAIGRSVAKVGG
jgi:DNA-binding transcriptional LysR family regulator